ncbi:exodeoxyribonuclease III [Aestuariivirga sp.]|uniref:exodeoxyribonuclease III n=1 Tax=Aestuariivirga sp. TaxID=2650926 RepID=UPI0039E55082
MTFKIATWNINSVRLRIDLVCRFLKEHQPDVLCLQETKCPQGQFPSAPLHDLGYTSIAESGQKGYHGVAIVSRIPFINESLRRFCGKEDCRHIAAAVNPGRPVLIHNFYIPAGGDEPDPLINEKFAHKLQFLDELEGWFREGAVPPEHEAIMVGDLNIAPLEHDVWSHKDLLKVVSHTPVETSRLIRVQTAGNWVDVMRQRVPPSQKLYTWWSYRAQDWAQSNRGRRLDHVWTTEGLSRMCASIEVLKDARGWPRPSDHVPVIAEFSL